VELERETPRRVFISYSHDSQDHKGWVLNLATRLVSNGIDAILDQWDTRLGSDLSHFMESGLTDADRVLVVSSADYVRKANSLTGGAGFEKRIITAQMMEDLTSKRVVPVVRGIDVAPLVPTFLAGLKYIDFRDPVLFEERYSELIHDLYGRAVTPRPKLGPNPFEVVALTDVPSYLATDPARYISRANRGVVQFDYLNNNGRFSGGDGTRSFELMFSGAGYGSVHVYNDAHNISAVAVAPRRRLEETVNRDVLDFSSRSRVARVGDTAVWRNTDDYFVYVEIREVLPRDDDTGAARMTFAYVIPLD
jgi:hypothetical protein